VDLVWPWFVMRFADAPQGQLRFNCLRVPVFDPDQYAVGRLRNKVVAGNARQLQFACLDAPKVSTRSGLLALGTAWKWHWIDRELQAHVAG
jgi:hypothetical protein